MVPFVIVSMLYKLGYHIVFIVDPRCSQTLGCCKTLPCHILAYQSRCAVLYLYRLLRHDDSVYYFLYTHINMVRVRLLEVEG